MERRAEERDGRETEGTEEGRATHVTHMSFGAVSCPFLPSPRHSLVPRSCREDWRKNDDKVNGKGTERDEVRDVGWDGVA